MNARRVAEALESARGKGVVQGDLKPGNMMVASAELVKILDFGLPIAYLSGNFPGRIQRFPNLLQEGFRAERLSDKRDDRI